MKQLDIVAGSEKDRYSVALETLLMLNPLRLALLARIGTLMVLLATLVVLGVLIGTLVGIGFAESFLTSTSFEIVTLPSMLIVAPPTSTGSRSLGAVRTTTSSYLLLSITFCDMLVA